MVGVILIMAMVMATGTHITDTVITARITATTRIMAIIITIIMYLIIEGEEIPITTEAMRVEDRIMFQPEIRLTVARKERDALTEIMCAPTQLAPTQLALTPLEMYVAATPEIRVPTLEP